MSVLRPHQSRPSTTLIRRCFELKITHTIVVISNATLPEGREIIIIHLKKICISIFQTFLNYSSVQGCSRQSSSIWRSWMQAGGGSGWGHSLGTGLPLMVCWVPAVKSIGKGRVSFTDTFTFLNLSFQCQITLILTVCLGTLISCLRIL